MLPKITDGVKKIFDKKPWYEKNHAKYKDQIERLAFEVLGQGPGHTQVVNSLEKGSLKKHFRKNHEDYEKLVSINGEKTAAKILEKKASETLLCNPFCEKTLLSNAEPSELLAELAVSDFFDDLVEDGSLKRHEAENILSQRFEVFKTR